MNEDINIGAITEALNNKVDLPSAPPRGQDEIDYVVDWQRPTEENSYTWYRRYKSGWVEQGGRVIVYNNSNATVTLPIVMAGTDYTITLGQKTSNQDTFYTNQAGIVAYATSTMVLTNRRMNGTATHDLEIHWMVCGYAA